MVSKIKKRIVFLFSVVFLIMSNGLTSVFAKEIDNLSKSEKTIIEKANKYFMDVSTIKSNFVQYNDFDGGMAEGIFYILKPNKLRFEYTTPFKALLITNGKITTFYDMDLDEISNVPTFKTPLNFLLQDKQTLYDKKITIKSIKTKGEVVNIKTEYNYNDNVYGITYIFDKEIKNLKGIDFVDENKQEINLTLFNSEKNIDLDKSLFVFKNPRLYKKRK